MSGIRSKKFPFAIGKLSVCAQQILLTSFVWLLLVIGKTETSSKTKTCIKQKHNITEKAHMNSVCSAVTIIVFRFFIAIFQNYRIVSLSRYFLCVQNDIFPWHLRYASMIDSPPVYPSFSTLKSHAANDVTCVIAARRLWLSSVSVREKRRNCLWSNLSQVVSVARAVFMTSQLTITSVCLCYGFQVSVLCSVWMEN